MPQRFVQRMSAITRGRITAFDFAKRGPVDLGAGSVRPPAPVKPQLFLVEQYRLTSFKGDLARDEMIGSFSLSPHSELTYTMIARTSATQSNELTTTVMESQDSAATKNFNEHLKQSADSRFGKNTYNYQMDASFHGEASVNIDGGDADADLHAKGNTEDVREDFAKSAESAVDSQISATSQYRAQRAMSGAASTITTQSSETKFEKKTVNDTSEPMNIGIFQLKEEIVALLCLVDVTVAFGNTKPEQNRSVTLRELDRLLADVIATAQDRETIKRRIKTVLESVLDYQDVARSIIADAGGGTFAVNRRLESVYELKSPDGSVRRKITVPGIILKDFRRYLRKPNTSVELNLNV